MPVHHMVWIRFNPDVSAARIEEHLENLRSMSQYIPAIHDLHVGAEWTDRPHGFTHGLIVTVAGRGDLPAYIQHPYHVQVAGPLKQDAQLMAMDIES